MTEIFKGYGALGIATFCLFFAMPATAQVCGDSEPDVIEQCDDGNTTNGDGCSATCEIESGFDCSEAVAGTPSTLPIPSSCIFAQCGDIIQSPGEQCDDGNTTNGDGCSATCEIESGFVCSAASLLSSPIVFPSECIGFSASGAVFDDFEDSDSSDWNFFGGNNAGGGGGPLADRPKEGAYYLSTGWGGNGTASGFYGGAYKNLPNGSQLVLPPDPWFNVWVLNQSNSTADSYRLEITIREDVDGDGWTPGFEDSFRLDTSFTSTSFNDEWTLISAPVSSFANLGDGGNGLFDGKLDEMVLVISDVVGGTGAVVEVDFDQITFTSAGPIAFEQVVFDDMEHGNPFGNGWFAFGGSVGIGGIGTNSADLPPSDGGAYSLEAGFASGGAPGFYGGFGRQNPTDVSGTAYFNFWINPDEGQDYTLEINLQEDDNGDGAINTADDDEFQFNCVISPSGPCAVSGAGWQLVSIPLADFFDDNSFITGGNSILDPTPTARFGNGELITVVFAVIGNSDSDATFRTDYWNFTLASPLPEAPPVANAGGPYTVNEGGSVPLDSSGSSDAEDDNDSLTFEWDLDNNGSFETAGASPSFSAIGRDGPDSQTIVLRVTDSSAMSATDTATVTINNVAPTISTNEVNPSSINEGQQVTVSGTFTDPGLGAGETFTGGALWSDGVSTIVTVGAGTFSTSRTFADDDPTATPSDNYTVDVSITDSDAGFDTDTSPTLTVNNVNPTAVDDGAAGFITDEDSAFDTVSVLTNDTDPGTDQLMVAGFDTTGTKGLVKNNSDGTFNYDPNGMFEYLGEGDSENDSFTYTTVDDDTGVSNAATVTITINGVNDRPVIDRVTPAAQTADYSDKIAKVTIVAHDIDSHPLSLSEDAPESLILGAANCTATTHGTDCTWEMTGQVTVPGLKDYTITFQANDSATLNNLSDTAIHTLTVHPEDATVMLDSDNNVAVEVPEADGDSGEFRLWFSAVETNNPDNPHDGSAEFGNLNKMVPIMTLVPVGPGGPVSGSCVFIDDLPVYPDEAYDQVALFECTFNGVPVNTYEILAEVNGETDTTTFYEGSDESVLVVYDPSLGFTTGGGWFYWPDTGETDYPGDKTNFGFNLKYNKKKTNVQGNLLLMRHTITGETYKVKSNALDGLGLGGDADGTYGWAAFSGKATFREPGLDNEGNHTFLTYVEDHDSQGCGQDPADEFWIEVKDKDGLVVLEVNGPDSDPAGADEATDGDDVAIECGNIVVPHKSSGGKGGGKKR